MQVLDLVFDDGRWMASARDMVIFECNNGPLAPKQKRMRLASEAGRLARVNTSDASDWRAPHYFNSHYLIKRLSNWAASFSFIWATVRVERCTRTQFGSCTQPARQSSKMKEKRVGGRQVNEKLNDAPQTSYPNSPTKVRHTPARLWTGAIATGSHPRVKPA